MSKQYKGWEIAKMISEGTLKAGDVLKSGLFYYEIVGNHLERISISEELVCSMLASKTRACTIVQKPVSFMEAVDSGKRFRIEHERIPKHYFYLDDLFFYLGQSNTAGICADVIKNGKCYIEESETDE